ncbi:MAG: YitT family protein [Ruminococcaceae bacterium]|nr:YitT family protein [Oscillospiraceae bacterium]
MKKPSLLTDILLTVAASVLSAIGLHVFVNAAGFAPSGVDGIAMMTQELTGINMGYVSLALNLPLLLAAWFFISRKYVVYTLLYTFLSSVMLIVAEQIELYQYVTQTNTWLAVFASGILLGVRTGIMVRMGASSGGMDIIAGMVQKRRPYLNVETLISLFCYIIIGLSFFVYHNLESVMMSVVQMMVFNLAMGAMLKPSRNAVEVRIITDLPEQFKTDILQELGHGATVIPCQGMFTGEQKSMIVTLINLRQMNDLIKISRRYPGCFIYYSETAGVWGNFRWNRFDKLI